MSRSMGGLRTLRGSFNPTGSTALKRHLILDDGRLNEGLQILRFTVWSDFGAATAGCDATLSLDPITSGTAIFNAADNRQIAWTSGGWDAAVNVHPFREIIDPNHIVNRDLYITMSASPNITWNYLIICQPVSLSDDESIITMIKENLQG